MTKKIKITKEEMSREISKLISEGKSVSLTAQGYSMNPMLFHLRDTVTLGQWKDEDLKKGAIVLARDIRGNILMHRVIKREGNILTLAGDGNLGQKEKATTDNVIGLMHSFTRKGRTYSAKNLFWRAYGRIWMATSFMRRYPIALWRKLNPQPPLYPDQSSL